MNTDDNKHARVNYLRQLALDILQRYSGGFAELEQIDRDLKSIIQSLGAVTDPAWMRLLLRQWGQLEIIYASVLNDGRLVLTQEEEDDAHEVVAHIIAQLQSYEASPHHGTIGNEF